MLGPSDGKQQLHSHLCLQSFSARVQREGPAVALGCSLSGTCWHHIAKVLYLLYLKPKLLLLSYAYMSSCLILKEWETRGHSSAHNVH